MQILHYQDQRFSPAGHWGLVTGAVALLTVALLLGQAVARIALLGTAGLLILALLVFERLRVVVTPEDLRVGFLVFRSRIPLGRLRSVEVLPAVQARRYGGLGVRLGLQGELAYVARSGPGLRVIAEGRRWPLVFTCDRPEEVRLALAEAGATLAEEGS